MISSSNNRLGGYHTASKSKIKAWRTLDTSNHRYQASIAATNQTKTMKQNRLKESVNCVKKMNYLKLSHHAPFKA